MKQQALLDYLESMPGALASYPFGKAVRVYKVGNRMFALISESDSPWRINLKCEPNEASALRDIFKSVEPGYHMNKQHWNTVILAGDVPEGELLRMIDNSYQLIVQKLPKTIKAQLQASGESG